MSLKTRAGPSTFSIRGRVEHHAQWPLGFLLSPGEALTIGPFRGGTPGNVLPRENAEPQVSASRVTTTLMNNPVYSPFGRRPCAAICGGRFTVIGLPIYRQRKWQRLRRAEGGHVPIATAI